jgi:flavin reductase (DIM6/NTAB) family NADH-FMN oxidoreductase RutF
MAISPLDDRTFRRACGHFATGVAIATVRGADGTPHGLTVNSFTSVSLTPPLVLVCLDHRASVMAEFLAASHYAINILTEEQEDLSNRFARRLEQRFEDTAWHPGETGAPIIEGCLASIECEMRQVIEAGDHAILLAEAVHAKVHHGRPLLFFSSVYSKVAES